MLSQLLFLLLSELLSLLLSELLSLLLIELLSLLLGLQLLPGLLLGLLLLSFSPPGPSSFVFTSIGRLIAALQVHTWRITGKVHALVASMNFKIQSGPGACSDALMVMHHEAWRHPDRKRKMALVVAAIMSCIYCIPVESSGRRRSSKTAALAFSVCSALTSRRN
jgi:hypothetical protein